MSNKPESYLLYVFVNIWHYYLTIIWSDIWYFYSLSFYRHGTWLKFILKISYNISSKLWCLLINNIYIIIITITRVITRSFLWKRKRPGLKKNIFFFLVPAKIQFSDACNKLAINWFINKQLKTYFYDELF